MISEQNQQFQTIQTIQADKIIRYQPVQVSVSVLKHLTKPLQIMQTETGLQFPEPICYYPQKLTILSQYIFPCHQNTKNLPTQLTKLRGMQNMQFQFYQIKKNFQRQRQKLKTQINHHNQQDDQEINNKKTLFNMFCYKIPYYCRFEKHKILRSNFANMFINVCGINLQLKAEKKQKRFPKLNHQKRFNSGALIFDSNFQSGNLLYVYQDYSQKQDQNSLVYTLILQNDTNTYGHNQWFFFRVQSQKTNINVKFNIVNLIKKDSLFNYGLKPLVFSQKDNSKSGIGWVRRGQNIRYYENDIRRQNKKSFYYTLSFEYFFKENKDWVYFCPSYPYTYTQMTNFIENTYLQPNYKNCFSLKTLNQTLGRNKTNLITLSTGKKPIQQCKVVWILARQHPTETTSSYMVEGILKYLLPLISSAKTSSGSSMDELNNFVFKIIPILNVDGVIHGNSRAGLNGLDPNRCWKKPKKGVNPDNYYIIKEILNHKANTSLILDLHSHSKKTGCFFYGNQQNYNSKIHKIFPTLVCENDQRFCLKNCRFRGGYKTTARHVLYQQLKIENIFTVQCSLLGYLKNNRVVEYSIQDYYEMGAKLIQTYLKFQNFKVQRNITDIINEYSEMTEQICQIDSAKSDSDISDDQYQQIKQLQKKIINKKSKSVNVRPFKKKVENQNIINVSALTKQRKACSILKDQKRYSLYKKQNIKNFLSNKKQIQISKTKDNKLCCDSNLKKDIINTNVQNLNASKYAVFKQKKQQAKTNNSYLRILKNMNIYSQKVSFKNKIVQFKKNKQGKDISIQVSIPYQRILQSSNPNILDPRLRPLCVLGNPVQSEFSVYPKNQVSIQINLNEKQDDTLKKQTKLISKLPKLINNIINLNRIKKNSCKQNTFYDTKSLLHMK